MSLEKILALAGTVPDGPDLDGDLLLAAQSAASELAVLLASGDEDAEKDDGDEGGGDHASHATYKALVKRNIPPKRAAAMCARSDKNVKASQLAASLREILGGKPGTDIALVTLSVPPSETAEGRRKAAGEGAALADGSYPIKSKRQLHSAAVLAASHRGDWKGAQRLIRRMAPKFGVDISSLPGFGSRSDEDGEKVAAAMIELAARTVMGDGGIAMNHAPHTGTHVHTHFQSAAHSHPHQHVNDNNHDGGPLHRPGSAPKRMW